MDLERYPFLLIILQVNILQADSKINKNIQYCFYTKVPWGIVNNIQGQYSRDGLFILVIVIDSYFLSEVLNAFGDRLLVPQSTLCFRPISTGHVNDVNENKCL